MKTLSQYQSFCKYVVCTMALCFVVGSVSAKEPTKFGPDKKTFDKAQQKAINFLRNSQLDDGSWTSPKAPGISALVLNSLMQNGVKVDDPTIVKGLKRLEDYIQKDGGIYYPKGNHLNYETCIALIALNAANKDGRYTKTIKNAENFLRGLQWDKGEGAKTTDPAFGGGGYGKHQRPDMSNTQFLVEALKTAGVKADDTAMKNALIFVSRAQNLESEHNNTKFAAKINDGGFYYTPAAGGETKAGITDNGGLRSYASMTYAGLKSMIYAGLTKDDIRVKSAYKWIQKNYTLETNKGVGLQGLYYYYHTFAKALDIFGKDIVVDSKGKKHDWRKELAEKLFSLQKPNGSWINKADRWNEGDPSLVTAFSLMALKHCEPPKKTKNPK
ncbi:hypothetical protein MNBD_PLANCTO02-2697 [hydrothermal vent metagenome]|uniref:Squalene cyclase C-terminal domain-containing protein n=1 Tax=hydrothermal vent metagenome TaxID=652676 RepID=A0A3B1E3W7_9ZZZZ